MTYIDVEIPAGRTVVVVDAMPHCCCHYVGVVTTDPLGTIAQAVCRKCGHKGGEHVGRDRILLASDDCDTHKRDHR